MAILKCKMCGGDLEVVQGATVATCEFCTTQQTIPSADNEKKITLFTRANRLRFGCDFDKAAGVYEAIVADFPEEAEAYWGLILCKYGIEYVDDPLTGAKIPTCHRSAFESVMDDYNFEMVMEYADVVARKVYREEAKVIEELRKGIIEVSSKEEPYDIFICYKETAPDGQRTLDSVMAQDVYDALTDEGYRVFFARISLEDKIGQEYEPYIFAALNSAKVMLVFGTDYDYFNAVWVKNEWSRFLHLMTKDKSKHLIPCYKNIDAYDMPKEFQRLQAQDLGKIGATQDLLRGIEKLIPKAAPKQAEPRYEAPREQPVEKLPFYNMNVISNVLSVGANDSNDVWPKNSYSTKIDIDKYSCVFFHINLTRGIGVKRDVKLSVIVYDDIGNQVSDLTSVIACEPTYDRFSKGLILRGADGSSMATGRYRVKVSVDDSKEFFYNFEIVSFRRPEPVYTAPVAAPVFDSNVEQSKLKLTVKDSINPMALASGATYLFIVDGAYNYAVIAGSGDVTEEFMVPVGTHTLALKVYGYTDPEMKQAPMHTLDNRSFEIRSGRATRISASRPGLFSSVKLETKFE